MKQDPYKKIAGYYDRSVEPFVRSLRKYGLKVAPAGAGMRVLEVGCGTGTNLKMYHRRGCDVYGIDLSPTMIEAAKAKLGEKANLVLGDASDMPFDDDFFDLAIAMLTLHEMPSGMRDPVIREMKRVIKKSGRILLIDYHPGPLGFPGGWANRLVIWFFEIAAGWNHFKNFRNFIAAKGLPALIAAGDLEVKKKKILGGGNLAVILAGKTS
jgi:ubiquinone/menaquinone biosynthesis C-methylase UbiE